MHVLGFLLLIVAFAVCVGISAYLLLLAFRGEDLPEELAQWGQAGVTCVVGAASAVLLFALLRHDFSFDYVASYTDRLLPTFYTATAFWAGQAGSLLFWLWSIAIFSVVFASGKGYAALPARTRLIYWIGILLVQAFFLALLTGPSNPFAKSAVPLADGRGLNPLLRNPGMIFHPPLLFLGYAGLTVSGCLGLAAWLTGAWDKWLAACRGATIVSWVLLTAGIILGCWWAYMELGWGGYWAWDPVENASLIPWLTASAFLHTSIIQSRRGMLPRTNMFLAVLTMNLCFFGTWVVRSGVIDSVHAFGEGGVGNPLLLFILLILAASVIALFHRGQEPGQATPMASPLSLPGALLGLACLLCASGLIVFIGTMWPVLAQIVGKEGQGLTAAFYNKACNPLFAVMSLLAAFCPWLSWGEGLTDRRGAVITAGIIGLAMGTAFSMGVRDAVPMLGIGGGVGMLGSLSALFALRPASRRPAGGLGGYLVHAGLALVVLGMAVSGPYSTSRELILNPGDKVQLREGLVATFEGITETRDPAVFVAEGRITVTRNGVPVGELAPQKRIYKGFEQQSFAEVSTIFSLGEEIYATMVGFSQDKAASVKISLNPLVNWIWIGGTVMCLAGFVCLARPRGRNS